MPDSRRKIRIHAHIHLSTLYQNIREYSIVSFLHLIHLYIDYMSHFRDSLLRQSLLENYHGFHRVSYMLIISQMPLCFILEHPKLVKVDPQETG